jgi:hypothetical protein
MAALLSEIIHYGWLPYQISICPAIIFLYSLNTGDYYANPTGHIPE